MNLIEQLIQASPLEVRCPICYAERGEFCAGGEGRSHSARELLRICELEAVAPVACATKVDMLPG